MQQRSATRARGHLSRGALISLLVHLNLVAPLVIAAWIYGGREEAQRAEEVDVAFQDASDTVLPADLPPIESTPEPQEAPAKMARERKVPLKVAEKKPEQEKKEKIAEEKKREEQKKELLKPEPEVVVPPLPPMPQSHQKIVDLEFKSYIAESNARRVAVPERLQVF